MRSSVLQPKVVCCALIALAGPYLIESTSAQQGIDQREVALAARALLTSRCILCHGPDESNRQGGFRLDDRDSYLSPADSGEPPIVLDQEPSASPLWQRIHSDDPLARMPPEDSGPALTDAERNLISHWIELGAQLPMHWSFVPPQRPILPTQIDSTEAVHWTDPIDRFVASQQSIRGLAPSPEAERSELLRRVSIDLIGLPPTLEELGTFENDTQPDAYERQVDRLLASPSFGEHWARKWLDLARYADSAGYADDPDRTIWAYRDWVIRAINDNIPIDQFTIEQLAGDLLPNPTNQQLIATAFHRNTLTNNEGGTNDEEFRDVAIVDRVNTTMAVWMGITMNCAQCHTHKYDPFTQQEYYQLFAIFNQTADADRTDESPTIKVYSTTDSGPIDRKVLGEIKSLSEGKNFVKLLQRLTRIKLVTSVPIMRELEIAQNRKTHIHVRGDYKSLGEVVEPGTPAVFAPAENDLKDDDARKDFNRLDLARWLVDPDNPLTARVWVNRMWESLFGAGIVRTSEEFGAQGDPPSHPELLDWLATQFVSLDWDFKALLRKIVTSQTYRQSSRVTDELLAQDPDNVWLARGPRVRLGAETIRDVALHASGLLTDKMYGPPALPPQPNLGLKAAFGSDTDWAASQGENRYRRGVYTKWRRSNPYPSMATFDAPSREVCILRRDRTNTPLQALVTLNDPVYVEAAQSLARRIVSFELPNSSTARNDESPDGYRMSQVFRLCTSRMPETREVTALLDLLSTARIHFTARPDEAIELATVPLGPLPAGSDAVELAAWTSVCNVLLNLDEVLMKR